MPHRFRRRPDTTQARRPSAACEPAKPDGRPGGVPALLLALTLLDRSPRAMATQVRAWLAEADDA